MKNKILKKNNITGRELLQKKIIDMPEKPGVYRMLGIKKNVLYVGKSKNLKKRLLSYTRPNLIFSGIQVHLGGAGAFFFQVSRGFCLFSPGRKAGFCA